MANSFYDQLINATGPTAKNLSLFAVPAMWFVNMSAHFYAISLTKGKFTNASPRDYVNTIARKEKKEDWEQKFIRAEAAQMNGFENIGWFAAAVVAANVAKVPAAELNSLAGGYLLLRVLYNYFYITVTDETLATLRSVLYVSSVAVNMTLFIKAGLRLQ